MGLTIHYRLNTKLKNPKDVRQVVETMRQFALDLPFKEVSKVKEFKGGEADVQNKDDDDRWLKIQAGAHVVKEERYYQVVPQHMIAIHTWPGDGCEAANFGFCQYPSFISVESSGGRKRRLETGLTGWQWKSFCKTQYASDPECGGVQNFLRCHLCVIKMLDFIKQSGLVSLEVSDEGGYWDDRDLEKLASEVGQWNEFIAGFAGLVKDAGTGAGIAIEAPITHFPNFEHLEAKGAEKLAHLRGLLKQPEAGE